MSSDSSRLHPVEEARAINRAFAARETALLTELSAEREAKRLAQDQLADLRDRLLAEGASVAALKLASDADHLAKTELTERIAKLSSELEHQQAQSDRLRAECDALRTEALRRESRGIEVVQTIVKDLATEQRLTIEALAHSATEREKVLTEAAISRERDLRAELSAVLETQGRLRNLIEQLTAERDRMRATWAHRLSRLWRNEHSLPAPTINHDHVGRVSSEERLAEEFAGKEPARGHASSPPDQDAGERSTEGPGITDTKPNTMPIESPEGRFHPINANLNGLLKLEGAEFLQSAYQAILKRPPDPEGSRHFQEQLKVGVSKLIVLRCLIESNEAKSRLPNNAQLLVEIESRLPAWSQLRRRVSKLFKPRDRDRSHVLADLLARDGEDFVRATYHLLLRREPDESGLTFYLQELLAGHPKIDIVGRIFRSKERIELGTALEGLGGKLRWQRAARIPLLGSLAKRCRAEGYSASDFSLRRTEQKLEKINNRLALLTMATRPEEQTVEARLSEIIRRLNGQGNPQQTPNTPIFSSDSSHPSSLRTERQLADELRSRVTTATPLRPTDAIYFYVDHTIQCPVNTGMQRVVRRLGRALIEQGRTLVFVKFDASLQQLVRVSQEDLAYLGKWNGPALNGSQMQEYPTTDETTRPIERKELVGSWLLVPEVTHITYHERAVTLDLVLVAKRLNLQIAFIYYDAIPLRLPNYKDTSTRHEVYMQQLLLADVIIPISRRSAVELDVFFRSHQLSASSRPFINTISLPAESQLTTRLFSSPELATDAETILCVGSIEPRKNQLTLLKSFDSLSKSRADFRWKLILAGNLRGDIAEEVNSIIERNQNISHVQNIADEELDVLYRNCSFTVFPSVEEGFGLPILESLWYAKPCICANFGAMAEVAEGGGCMGVDTRSQLQLRAALEQMTLNVDLRSRLTKEAAGRVLPKWSDYADDVTALLSAFTDPKLQLGPIYFWVDDTSVNQSNSGIQRVTRQLSRALLSLGVKLIPACWNSSDQRLRSTRPSELEHLARWEGPEVDSWATWVEPSRDTTFDSWILVPELVHGSLPEVKKFATEHGLRCAALFYDAIPYKFKADYGIQFGLNHRAYMTAILDFDAVFPISEFSRQDLLTFYITKAELRSAALDHRVKAMLLPDEFSFCPRQTTAKLPSLGSVRIIAVASVEPRKNILTLLAAVRKAQVRSSVQISFTLVGRRMSAFAGLAEQVEEQIAQLRNSAWEEDVDDVRLNELYRDSDFTVFPSLEEGYGLPIVESLWNGRPCLCHDDGAMKEVAEGGGCVLVDMRDADALSDAIVELAEAPSLRDELSTAAFKRSVRTWKDYGTDILRALVRLASPSVPNKPTYVSDPQSFYRELPNLVQRPLLTVAISTFNRAGWLGVSLRNLAKLIPIPGTEVEILVCDNCSDDNTPDVVAPYLWRSDFKYIRNLKNVGMLGNLQVTSNSANGQYIWILGDDDLPFSGSIDRILQRIQENRDAALVYLNYTYTRETDPESVVDLDAFLRSGTPVAASTADRVTLVKDVATVNENLFTAIYCLIFRRDHALRAYSQDTSGRPFSTMLTSIPTTAHVLNNMMYEKVVWIGDPQVLVNFNVSWNSYASLQILERVPEALDLAELKGADPGGVDKLRDNLIPGYVHYFTEIFGDDPKNNSAHFSITRVISRVRHLERYKQIAPELNRIYKGAHEAAHPAATVRPEDIFDL